MAEAEAIKLITPARAALIVRLMLEIGLAPGTEGMLLAQLKVGGTAQPFGYLLLSRQQGESLIELMFEYLTQKRVRERASASV